MCGITQLRDCLQLMAEPGATSPAEPSANLRWLKADLHLHTSEDPLDTINYDARQLLQRAAHLGFRIIAITLHKHVLIREDLTHLAADLGILLIPSVELRIDGCDVIVWNIQPDEAASIHSFDDLRALRHSRGDSMMVMAPHPFYVLGGSIGRRIEAEMDCFDAMEYCHFHARWFNPNQPALRLAEQHGLPLIATSDAHRLWAFGRFYSEIGIAGDDVLPPSISDVFHAIRAHKVRRISPPHTLPQLIAAFAFLFLEHPVRCILNRRDHLANQPTH